MSVQGGITDSREGIADSREGFVDAFTAVVLTCDSWQTVMTMRRVCRSLRDRITTGLPRLTLIDDEDWSFRKAVFGRSGVVLVIIRKRPYSLFSESALTVVRFGGSLRGVLNVTPRIVKYFDEDGEMTYMNNCNGKSVVGAAPVGDFFEGLFMNPPKMLQTSSVECIRLIWGTLKSQRDCRFHILRG